MKDALGFNWPKLCTSKLRGSMGFKNLDFFNLALLAKQAWRLIQSPHSLFYQVFKVKQFPTIDFQQLTLG